MISITNILKSFRNKAAIVYFVHQGGSETCVPLADGGSILNGKNGEHLHSVIS